MSKVLMTGKAVREAAGSGCEPAEAFARQSGGMVFFRGEVSDRDWENKSGYMFGNTYITGQDEYQGDILRIWFKNENHVAWKNDTPCVLSPDLIQIVDQVTGQAIMNDQLMEGMQVAVVAIPNPTYRTNGGFQVLGPAHFGFSDIPYKPVEELLQFDRELINS